MSTAKTRNIATIGQRRLAAPARRQLGGSQQLASRRRSTTTDGDGARDRSRVGSSRSACRIRSAIGVQIESSDRCDRCVGAIGCDRCTASRRADAPVAPCGTCSRARSAAAKSARAAVAARMRRAGSRTRAPLRTPSGCPPIRASPSPPRTRSRRASTRPTRGRRASAYGGRVGSFAPTFDNAAAMPKPVIRAVSAASMMSRRCSKPWCTPRRPRDRWRARAIRRAPRHRDRHRPTLAQHHVERIADGVFLREIRGAVLEPGRDRRGDVGMIDVRADERVELGRRALPSVRA